MSVSTTVILSKELQQSADDFAEQLSGEIVEAQIRCIGDSVTNPAFGEGTIVGYGKNHNSYRIRFDKLSGERDISADFLNRSRPAQAMQITDSPAPAFPAPQEPENLIPAGFEKAEELSVPEMQVQSIPLPPTPERDETPPAVIFG